MNHPNCENNRAANYRANRQQVVSSSQFNFTKIAMSTPQALLSLLTELENELILLTLWSEHLPSAEALNSRQPFAYDTLKFEQWLQFIFIPRVTQMVQSDHPLPTEISLTPMAQMAYQDRLVECKALLLILSKIDHLMQGTEHA